MNSQVSFGLIISTRSLLLVFHKKISDWCIVDDRYARGIQSYWVEEQGYGVTGYVVRDVRELEGTLGERFGKGKGSDDEG